MADAMTLLAHGGIGDEGGEALAESLMRLPHNACWGGRTSSKKICRSVTSLREFDFSQNEARCVSSATSC